MAHLKKYNMSAVGHIAKHDERAYTPPSANKDLREQNICMSDGTIMDNLNKRLGEVQHSKRSNLCVMCSWVVTLPDDFPIEREDDFWYMTCNFLERKYGKENVLGAYVHKDEPTARHHMHFTFCPVVLDKKTGKEKVCAKELITRQHLQKFHNELKHSLENALGVPCNVLSEERVQTNQKVEKQRKRYDNVLKATKELEQTNPDKLDLVMENVKLKAENQSYRKKLELLKSRYPNIYQSLESSQTIQQER